MQREALDTLGHAIKANTQTKTLDQLKAEGKKKFRVVSGSKVMKIIQAIVNDIIEHEVGEITSRDRDRIVKDTKKKFNRVLELQNEQEERIEEVREELRGAEVEVERLKGDKAFLEAQLRAARKAAGDGQSVSRLGLELAEIKAGMQTLEQRSAQSQREAIEKILGRLAERDSSADSSVVARFGNELEEMRNVLRNLERKVGTVQEKTLDALADREARGAGEHQVAARLGAELEQLKDALRSLDARAAAVKDETVGALLDKLEEREARIVGRFGDELDSVKTEIEALEKRAANAQREALSEIVERLTAARGDDAASSLEVTAELEELRHGLQALGEQSTAVQQQAVESLLERLGERESVGGTEVIERLTAELSSLQTSMAQRFETAELAPAQAMASITTELSGLKDELRELADKSSVAQETTVAVLAARLEALEAGELEAVSSITSELGSLREDLRAVAEHAASAQEASVTQEIAGVKQTLERRQEESWAVLSELQGEMGSVKEALAGLHQKAIEVDEATVDALVCRLAERESKDAEDMQKAFQTAVETAVTQIEKAVYRATAKPIEHSVEATDVLVNKIFDNEDGDTSTNLDRLRVDQRTSKLGIVDTLGKLRRMRGGNNKKK